MVVIFFLTPNLLVKNVFIIFNYLFKTKEITNLISFVWAKGKISLK